MSSIRSVKKIIKAGKTTRSELEKLATTLGISSLQVNWINHFDPNYTGFQILNLGNRLVGGTHWVAYTPADQTGHDTAVYFDSYGLPPPPQILNQTNPNGDTPLTFIPLQIQSLRSGHCGSYCVLFLWYMKRYGNTIGLAKFYTQFNIDVNTSGPVTN